MEPLVFASGNPHKVEEVAKKMGGSIALLGLRDINCTEEIPETSDTLAGNAHQKANYVWTHFGKDCFADDTGLEVYALHNEPGVLSARYAGEQKNSEDNINKLLEKMKDEVHRAAQFRTVICLILHTREYYFEGITKGSITRERRGELGFGYDAIFIPEGNSRTFAQMSMEEKNLISHRGKAIQQLTTLLKMKGFA